MASRFWVGGTGNWNDTGHWSSTSGGASGSSVPTTGDSATLDASSGGGTVTADVNISCDSITMGAFTGTLDANGKTVTLIFFDGSGTGTRTITMGSGTWTLTGNAATIWNLSTATNLTVNPGTVTCTYSGSTGTRTISAGSPVQAQAVNFNISSGTDTVNITSTVNNLNFTGFSGTLSTGAITSLFGNLTFGAGMSIASTSNAISLRGTGSKTITSNGCTCNRQITLDGTAGGDWTLGDNLTIDSTHGFNISGTFNANNYNVTVGSVSTTSSTITRTITMGSGTWSLTSTSTGTIWGQNNTVLTISIGNPIRVTGAAIAGVTRTITVPALESKAPSFNITAGADTITVGTAVGSLDFVSNSSSFTGNLSNSATTIYGSLSVKSGMTLTAGTNTVTFAATSGVKTITSNGVNLDFPINFNGVGGTFQLSDNLNVGTSTARTITLTNGTFDINGKTLTHFGTVTNTGTGTRVAAFGTNGVWDITATATSTVWNSSGTSFSTTGTGTIKISGSTTNVRTFAGGDFTYSNLWFSNATSGGQLTISGSNTFNDFKCITPPQTILFTAGTTQTFTTFTVSGSTGNLITINSTTTGTHALVKSGGGTVSCDYLNIQHSVATPSSTWYAGTHSTDNQAVATAGSGWIFTAPPGGLVNSGFFLMM